MINQEIYDLSFEEYLARIAAFTDDVLIPAEQQMVELGEVPHEVMAQIAEQGLFGITIPREWGGLGWNVEEQVRLTLEFTRASCVYRSRFSTVIGLSAQAILEHGTEEQRTKFLAKMAAGECVTAFALTEESAGSDATNVQTTATRNGDNYILNGEKRYITNGAWADMLIIFARVESDGVPSKDLTAFFVPRLAPGVSTRLPERMNGHAEGPVAEISLRDVSVSHSGILGGVLGQGLKQAMRGINHARIHVAATAVGQSTRMLNESVRHATRREQFGHTISEFGAVQTMIGRSFAEVEAGRALTIACAREFDADGRPPRHRISAAKLFCTEMASDVGDRALQILGGEGIVGDNPIPRMWRDVRALRIYEGASQIHERNLARFLTSEEANRDA